jgi:hypothetical protein
MTRRLQPPLAIRLADPDIERVRRNHHDVLLELQGRPGVDGYVVEDVDLEDATNTVIEHGLGRRARVFVSAVRNATNNTGHVHETQSDAYDDTRYAVLVAKGFGSTITADLWIL